MKCWGNETGHCGQLHDATRASLERKTEIKCSVHRSQSDSGAGVRGSRLELFTYFCKKQNNTSDSEMAKWPSRYPSTVKGPGLPCRRPGDYAGIVSYAL